MYPGTTNTYNLGTSDYKWKNVYATTLHGDGTNITNLNGSNIASGTVASARLPVASASAAGIVSVGTQTFAGKKTFNGQALFHNGSGLAVGGRYELPPVYSYANGCLIDICAAKASTMVVIHITGNSYTANVDPINSMYQFYDYGDGAIINSSGLALGRDLGDMKVYRYNDRLYAWVK